MSESVSKVHWPQFLIGSLVTLLGAIGGLKAFFTKSDPQGGAPTPAAALVLTVVAATPTPVPTVVPRVVDTPPAAVPFSTPPWTPAPSTPYLPPPPANTHRFGSRRVPEVKTKPFPHEPVRNGQYAKADRELNTLFNRLSATLDDTAAWNFLMEQRGWLNDRTRSWDHGGDNEVIAVTLRRNEELRARIAGPSAR